MAINDIALPGFAIATLYRTSLVQVPTPVHHTPLQQPSVNGDSHNVHFLGNNEKNVLVLVNYANDSMLPEKHMAFLLSMLKACSMNLDDTAIINTATQPLTLAYLTDVLLPVSILVFGHHTSLSYGVATKSYEITYIKQIPVLSAPPLEVFDLDSPDNKLNKSKLWNCLKSIFKIN